MHRWMMYMHTQIHTLVSFGTLGFIFTLFSFTFLCIFPSLNCSPFTQALTDFYLKSLTHPLFSSSSNLHILLCDWWVYIFIHLTEIYEIMAFTWLNSSAHLLREKKKLLMFLTLQCMSRREFLRTGRTKVSIYEKAVNWISKSTFSRKV